MSSKFITPFGGVCAACGKTLYLETEHDDAGAVRYSIWCPTKECRNHGEKPNTIINKLLLEWLEEKENGE